MEGKPGGGAVKRSDLTASIDIATAPGWRRHRVKRIAAADAGAVDAAQELIALAGVAMRSGLPLPAELAEWLSGLLSTADAASALLRAARRSRKGRPSKPGRDEALAALYVLHRRRGRDRAAAVQALLDAQVVGGPVFDQSNAEKIIGRADLAALSMLTTQELEALAGIEPESPAPRTR